MTVYHIYFIECGKTTEITKKIDKYKLVCSKQKPCYCYGRICLTGSQTCSEGNIFINGRPLCGVSSGWDKTFAGSMACKQLGFRNVIKVTSGR